MVIDCDSCTARPRACGDCIVTHLLQVGPARGSTEDSWPDPWDPADPAGVDADPPDDGWGERERSAELTDSEVAAVAVLSAGGLVPPLRLVTPSRPAAPVARAGTAGTVGRAGPRGSRSRTG